MAPVQAAQFGADEVIRLAQKRDPEALAAAAVVGVAKAEQDLARLLPNPSAAFEHEMLPVGGDNTEAEAALTFSLPIDISGRRRIAERLASSEVANARGSAIRKRSDAVAIALSVYYRLVAEQRRTKLQERANHRLVDGARIVGDRRAAGMASGYDQTRIEIEVELRASILRQTRARVQRLTVQLATRLGLDPTQSSFSGDLLPDNELALSAASGTTMGRPRELGMLHQASLATSAALAQTERLWVPELVLQAGPKYLGGSSGSRLGYTIGLAAQLPVISQGQELRGLVAKRRGYAAARASAAKRAAQIEIADARQTLVAAASEVQHFQRATTDRALRLERAALAGYREGHRSVVELLDARRARTAIELRQLELDLAVKQAEVRLKAASGEFSGEI